MIAVGFGVLLDDDGVSAARHRTAGKDANGLAGADGTRKGMASGRNADYFQSCRGGCDIGGANRIAIHGAGGKRRLVARGFQIAREDAAKGAIEFDDFGGERFDAGKNAGLRLFDRQQAHDLGLV